MCQNPTKTNLIPTNPLNSSNQSQAKLSHQTCKIQQTSMRQQTKQDGKVSNNNHQTLESHIINTSINKQIKETNNIHIKQNKDVTKQSQQQAQNSNMKQVQKSSQSKQQNQPRKEKIISNQQIQDKKQQNQNNQQKMSANHNKTQIQKKQIQVNNSQNRVFRAGEIIANQKKNICYKAIQLIGTGTFGQVLSVVTGSFGNNMHTMAMKVIKKQPAYINQGQIAKYEQKLQNSKKNYLKLYDGFMWEGHLCIAMELLDNSILNILESSSYQGLEMKWIQIWTKDILYSLAKIHKIGIIHCDIKPQNIMFRPQEPEKPLLIDFSSSFSTFLQGSQIFTYIQSRFYRSPQVLMGLKPYTNKIDIWSLGCVLAEMYLGLPLFPGGCGYDQISKIFKLVQNTIDEPGLIQMINKSQFGSKYFLIQKQTQQQQQTQSNQQTQTNFRRTRRSQQNQIQDEKVFKRVRLKTSKQYKQQNLQKIKINQNYFDIQKLQNMIQVRRPALKDIQTHQLFVDLIKKMLIFNPEERFSAQDAFLHPFVSGTFSQLANLRILQEILQEQNKLANRK